MLSEEARRSVALGSLKSQSRSSSLHRLCMSPLCPQKWAGVGREAEGALSLCCASCYLSLSPVHTKAPARSESTVATACSYVMLCQAYDKTQGIQLLSDAIDTMRDSIKASKGELQVKVAARAVDERDDKLLSSLMSTLEEQNREVEGDDDEEEVEGMGNVDIS